MNELFQVIKNSSSGGVMQSPFMILINLSLAAILGLFYAYVYRLTYRNDKGSKRIDTEMEGIQFTLLLLSVGGAFIWIVVADNLVRAFGLAGALSLIRFRTVVKDPMNTIKVFYAIIIGMSCGLGQYFLAIIGTIFMAFILTLIYLIKDRQMRLKALANNSITSEVKDNEK